MLSLATLHLYCMLQKKELNVVVDMAELKKKLSKLQYHVTQQKGTEMPFTGIYNSNKESGIYSCVVCHNNLFSSTDKYDSGSGWPSFTDAVKKGENVKLNYDFSHGMARIEVACKSCGSHLGHVFDDGPAPNGKRYCINSASLIFNKNKDK